MPDTPPRRRLMPTCHEVHQLTMQGLDRELGWVQRLRVRSHLTICDACTRFAGQMRLMRAAMRHLGRDDGAAGPRRDG